ncbi:hypothetical protein DRQ50_09135 [bacterium]|nr:MAG: hypothetical protein DRQ50_09135 [bacterium]
MNDEMYNNNQTAPQEPQQYAPPPPRPQAVRQPQARKSAVLATILSCMPGLGQVYVGYYQQGFIHVAVVALCITMLASGSARGFEPLFGVFLAFFWLYNMIDANRRAHHYNRMADGMGSENIPEEFPVPGTRGSVPVGIFMVVMGSLFLLDLNTDLSMAWLKDWWPLVLVGGGVWMILKARHKAE